MDNLDQELFHYNSDTLEEIKAILGELKSELSEKPPTTETHQQFSKDEAVERIENCVLSFVEDLCGTNCVQLRDQRPPDSDNSPGRVIKLRERKCALLLHLLSVAYRLLKTNTTSTKRDIYYEDVSLWRQQSALDVAVTELTRLVGVPRHLINIRATSKGLIAGSLTFLDAQRQLINCNVPNGVLIPSVIEQVSELRSEARCILVVEKDATFQKLLDDDVQSFVGPCILITGKGYPDVATRRMLCLLWEKLKIPPLALVDADPHGVSIMAVYRFGSQGLEDVEKLAVPQLRWLGIHPTDISNLKLPETVKLGLTSRDLSLLNSLTKRNFISHSPALKDQVILLTQLTRASALEKLREENCKVEIQSLTKLSAHYLTRTYLPSKIRTQAFL